LARLSNIVKKFYMLLTVLFYFIFKNNLVRYAVEHGPPVDTEVRVQQTRLLSFLPTNPPVKTDVATP
jgi:hypothetical protein